MRRQRKIYYQIHNLGRKQIWINNLGQKMICIFLTVINETNFWPSKMKNQKINGGQDARPLFDDRQTIWRWQCNDNVTRDNVTGPSGLCCLNKNKTSFPSVGTNFIRHIYRNLVNFWDVTNYCLKSIMSLKNNTVGLWPICITE